MVEDAVDKTEVAVGGGRSAESGNRQLHEALRKAIKAGSPFESFLFIESSDSRSLPMRPSQKAAKVDLTGASATRSLGAISADGRRPFGWTRRRPLWSKRATATTMRWR